ncbi:MAG: chalcone isomerase family protein [Pseudomonadota bacterium]
MFKLVAFIIMLHTTPGVILAAQDSAVSQSLPPQGLSGLVLRGEGLARYLVFEVYAARLYLPAGLSAERALDAGTPRRLSLSYRRAIQRGDIERAAWETLARQWSERALDKVRPMLDAMHGSMRDVREGDVYTLDYAPDQGSTLRLNGEVLWQGGDARLAEMYFGIWLRDPPLSDELRLALLGGAANP